ncbi:hypothetical protein RC74_16395 [Falsihalocynthiibacter arcticus]|uniref:Uncharacterized protein n=1 Tax=Falsihalocynthiibacter arcticus TaxID=1579316 RepID=A0A126V4L8_9RHOB|nr:hypothetical protein RC74_16395 [Falsihalocynthiibacter arcticus]
MDSNVPEGIKEPAPPQKGAQVAHLWGKRSNKPFNAGIIDSRVPNDLKSLGILTFLSKIKIPSLCRIWDE